MNRKQKQYSFRPPVVGGSSLLVMFCVLCLTTFAVLSLSTVRAGDRLAEASMEAVLEYYEADQEAERMLAKLRSGEIPEGVTAEEKIYSYTVPMSETQELQVSVLVDGEDWQVLHWNVVTEEPLQQ